MNEGMVQKKTKKEMQPCKVGLCLRGSDGIVSSMHMKGFVRLWVIAFIFCNTIVFSRAESYEFNLFKLLYSFENISMLQDEKNFDSFCSKNFDVVYLKSNITDSSFRFFKVTYKNQVFNDSLMQKNCFYIFAISPRECGKGTELYRLKGFLKNDYFVFEKKFIYYNKQHFRKITTSKKVKFGLNVEYLDIFSFYNIKRAKVNECLFSCKKIIDNQFSILSFKFKKDLIHYETFKKYKNIEGVLSKEHW